MRKNMLLVNEVVPKEYFTSAITTDHAYPAAGAASSGISIGMLLPFLI
jgi:hypothetical protein